MIRMLTLALSFALASPAMATDIEPFKPDEPQKAFEYVAKPSDLVMGEDKAPVTVVEYASLSCPHCAHFYSKVFVDIKKKYIDTGKVRFVYRNYPLNESALRAAQMVECADPERRHAFVKVLFATQDKWAFDIAFKDNLANIAALGGMDRKAFDACMSNKDVEATVLEVAKEAQDVYKISSTPTFFINGEQEKGDLGLESMSKSIDAALAKAGKK